MTKEMGPGMTKEMGPGMTKEMGPGMTKEALGMTNRKITSCVSTRVAETKTNDVVFEGKSK